MSARLVTHAALMPALPTQWQCGICGRPKTRGEEAPCERCGVVMHWTCYWPGALTEAERRAVDAAIVEDAAAPTEPVELQVGGRRFRFQVRPRRSPSDDFFDRLIVLCPGCRS